MFESLHQAANAALGPTLWLVLWSLIKIVAVVLPLMGCVAYLTLWERKAIGWSQIRPGPNRVGPLGLLQQSPRSYLQAGAGLDEAAIQAVIDARSVAKAARNFAEADRIRASLLAQGVDLKDSAQGTTWVRT